MSKYEYGLGTIVDPSSDKPFDEIPTTHCVHCGAAFPAPSFANNPASRNNRIGRGFCYNCNGFICGEKCETCKPFERWLDEMEGTKNPTAVSVAPGLWLPQE